MSEEDPLEKGAKKSLDTGESPCFYFYESTKSYKNTKNMESVNKIKYLSALIGLAVLVVAGSVLATDITPASVIKLVNESREESGLPRLQENEKLSQTAKDKLNDMIANQYFAHTSPAGVEPWHWFGENKYDYIYAGENLAINFQTAEAQHAAWMKSPTHKKNILNPNYSEIGVAVGAGEIAGRVSLIAVQEFGREAKSAVSGSEAENFSAAKNKNLISEGEKIVPQVLSVKEVSQSQKILQEKKNSADKNVATLDGLMFLFGLIFLLSVVTSPLVLIFIAEKIMNVWNNKNKREVTVSM
jgi:uncharacterized protein YkwD